MSEFTNCRDKSTEGMSDDALRSERLAQEALVQAISAFKGVLEFVNANSSLARIDVSAFDDFVHDYLPSMQTWDEELIELRG